MSVAFPQTPPGTEANWRGMAHAQAATGFCSSEQDGCVHTVCAEQPLICVSA